MLVSEGDEGVLGDEEFIPEVEEEVGAIELSLNSVVGLLEPRTMKLKGEIHGKEVVVFIDCGATHNFISKSMVESYQIPWQGTSQYGVVIGSGKQIRGMGVCKGVVLQLQGITIIEDFLPLPLGSTDVILGLKWLATLGEMRDDWRKLTMSFELGGKTMIFQRASLIKARVSFKPMVKELQQVKMGLMVELYQLIVNNENYENVTPKEQ